MLIASSSVIVRAATWGGAAEATGAVWTVAEACDVCAAADPDMPVANTSTATTRDRLAVSLIDFVIAVFTIQVFWNRRNPGVSMRRRFGARSHVPLRHGRCQPKVAVPQRYFCAERLQYCRYRSAAYAGSAHVRPAVTPPVTIPICQI